MLRVNMPEAYKIQLLEVHVPEVGDNDLLIEMKRIGICGSDIQVYHGKYKYMNFPIVQGHEGSGIVAEKGKNVKGFVIGDKVTVQPQVFCGNCEPCKLGNHNVCESLKLYGVHTNGLAQDYFNVNSSKVLKLPEDLGFDQGAFVESVAVGVHAVKRSGEIIGKNLIVLGAGTIGNLTAQVAKASGANVMITDINPEKLNIAKKCGISICVNTMDEDLGGLIQKYFGNRGADVIIDCAAAKASINQALNNARCSSKIIIVGKFEWAIEIEIPVLQKREVDIISAMMYVREDYEDAIELLSEGKINTDLLISKYFNIREFEEAYKFIDDNVEDVMKVILKISG